MDIKTIPDDFIVKVWANMALCPQHIFLILTKRPRRMLEFVMEIGIPNHGILPNVWLGCTVVNQQEADEKIPILRQIPAAVRFISVEPLLEQTDLCLSPGIEISAPYGIHGIHWVIAGGETGPGARPMHPAWARSVRDQCQAAGVPFFFKQWGEWAPHNEGSKYRQHCWNSGSSIRDLVVSSHVGKKAAGRLLDGREYNELPEVKG